MASSRAPRLCTIGVTALWHPRWIGQRCSPPRSARTRARQHGQSALAWLAARCPRGHPPPGSPTHLPVLGPSLSARWRGLASRLACRGGCGSALVPGQSRGSRCRLPLPLILARTLTNPNQAWCIARFCCCRRRPSARPAACRAVTCDPSTAYTIHSTPPGLLSSTSRYARSACNRSSLTPYPCVIRPAGI